MSGTLDLNVGRPTQPTPLSIAARERLQHMIQDEGAPAVLLAIGDITFGDLRRLPGDEQQRAHRCKQLIAKAAAHLTSARNLLGEISYSVFHDL